MSRLLALPVLSGAAFFGVMSWSMYLEWRKPYDHLGPWSNTDQGQHYMALGLCVAMLPLAIFMLIFAFKLATGAGENKP